MDNREEFVCRGEALLSEKGMVGGAFIRYGDGSDEGIGRTQQQQKIE